jgi:prevent-host-death family protein
MLFVNIHDAKTHLSKYLERIVQTHEEIIVCKNGQPIAKLVEYKPKRKRKLGLWKGKVKISSDFDELPEEFMQEFQ